MKDLSQEAKYFIGKTKTKTKIKTRVDLWSLI